MRKHFLIFFILIYLTQTLFSDEISGYQALFIKKTKLYSKIGNSHILIPLNLKIFEERIDSLNSLKDQVETSFKQENFKHLSKIDQREAKIVRDSLLFDIQISKNKMKEARRYLQVHHHEFENANIMHKRQLLIGLAGLVGGLVYSQISKSEALRVLQRDSAVISDEVRTNILKISQNERDIKILNKTSEILRDELAKVFIKSETNTMKITLLTINTIVDHYLKSCDDFVDGISEALAGRLTSKFISLLDLKDNLKRLKNKASSHGFRLSATSTLEIPYLPTTIVLNSTHINVLISVPIESSSSEFILSAFESSPIAIEINNETHYLTVKPEKKYLAVNAVSNQYIELSDADLNDCIMFSKHYHCPSLVQSAPTASTCLLSLYNNNFKEIRRLCPTFVSKHLIYGKKFNNNQFLIIDTDSKVLKITHDRKRQETRKFSGSEIIQLSQGMSVATKNLFVSRTHILTDFDTIASDLQVLENSPPINLKDLNLFHEHINIDLKALKAIDKDLNQVGTSLPTHEVKRIVDFNKKLEKIKIDSFWDNVLHIAYFICCILIIVLFYKCFMYIKPQLQRFSTNSRSEKFEPNEREGHCFIPYNPNLAAPSAPPLGSVASVPPIGNVAVSYHPAPITVPPSTVPPATTAPPSTPSAPSVNEIDFDGISGAICSDEIMKRIENLESKRKKKKPNGKDDD